MINQDRETILVLCPDAYAGQFIERNALMRAANVLRILLGAFLIGASGLSFGFPVSSALGANQSATPPSDIYSTPVDVPPAIPFNTDPGGPCKETECNGKDPVKAGCIDDLSLVERQQEVVVEDGIAVMHLVGAYPQSKCGSVQWARADPRGLQHFALRVVQCQTGLATEWAEFKDRDAPAWSPMISSPELCVWAEYAVPDETSPDGWQVIARTKPE